MRRWCLRPRSVPRCEKQRSRASTRSAFGAAFRDCLCVQKGASTPLCGAPSAPSKRMIETCPKCPFWSTLCCSQCHHRVCNLVLKWLQQIWAPTNRFGTIQGHPFGEFCCGSGNRKCWPMSNQDHPLAPASCPTQRDKRNLTCYYYRVRWSSREARPAWGQRFTWVRDCRPCTHIQLERVHNDLFRVMTEQPNKLLNSSDTYPEQQEPGAAAHAAIANSPSQ